MKTPIVSKSVERKLSQQFRRRRKDLGLTQREVAMATDITSLTICKFERNKRGSLLQVALKLAEFYNCDIVLQPRDEIGRGILLPTVSPEKKIQRTFYQSTKSESK